MNRSFKTIKLMALSGLILGGLFTSCQADPNSPGMEYMPDMYRSPSIEAYVDYGLVKERLVDSLIKDRKSSKYFAENPPRTGGRWAAQNRRKPLQYKHLRRSG